MPTDLSNWREPGHNIWGFQNADKIVATDPVKKGPEVRPLENDIREFDDFKVIDAKGQPMDMASFLTSTETDGIIVLKHGKIAFEHYDRTNSAASKHTWFSVSKSVTGLICGILVEQGKLVLDDTVSKYVPEVRGSSFQDVTIRQLLDMRAGLDLDENDPEYRKATGLVPLQPGEEATNLHQYIPTVNAPNSPPIDGLDGPSVNYQSVNADLMGWVIERAAGERFAHVLSRTIWQPMGAESDSYMMLDRGHNARNAAGLCATVRDVARLGQLLLSPPTESIIPATWVQDMVNNGSHEAYAAGSEECQFRGIFNTAAYRSYWIADKETGTLMASGTNGQILLVDLVEGVVLVKSSSQPERTNWDKIRLTLRAFREIERILC